MSDKKDHIPLDALHTVHKDGTITTERSVMVPADDPNIVHMTDGENPRKRVTSEDWRRTLILHIDRGEFSRALMYHHGISELNEEVLQTLADLFGDAVPPHGLLNTLVRYTLTKLIEDIKEGGINAR